MQTLIVFFAEHIREGGRSGGGGYRRHDAKYLDRQGQVGGAGGKNGGSDYYLGKSDNFLNKERGRKTPFEIFLEDDGPYSRKLYGPAPQSCETQNSKSSKSGHQGEKVTTSGRNMPSSKSTEYLVDPQDCVERDLRSISAIKKGLLWQQRDKLFSRSD